LKNISVTTFIHTIFILALVVISLTFYILLNSTQDQRKLQQFLRYQYITTTFLTPQDLKKNSPVLKKLYKNYSLHEIPISDFSSIFGRVRVFTVGNKYYIYVQRVNFDLMLQDEHPIDYTTQLIFTLAVAIVLFILFLYIMVIKKLSPLKKLNKQIEQFAGGDMNVKINHNGDDEIARIAKSFDKAIAHIRQLISSKNLFMRNIMHELKTPITTSRIVADTVEDEMAKGILIRSFDRMNELIEDLADVERVTMYNFKNTIVLNLQIVLYIQINHF